MDNEKTLSSLSRLMFALNLAIILFYSLVCLATTLRVCGSFGAYQFLSSAGQIPPPPWRMPLWALGQYLLLCAVSFGKTRWSIERFEVRLLVCLVEILLCLGVTASLNFYYSGAALLVLADLVHYVRNSFYRVCFTAALILLFSFGRYEILYPLTGRVAFSAYLDYYNQTVRSLRRDGKSADLLERAAVRPLHDPPVHRPEGGEQPHTEAEQTAEPGQRPPPGLRL